MPDTYPVSPRETIGKKVKRLRLEGVMPANIYGRGIESRAVQMPSRSALAMLRAHGLNTLVELDVEGEDAPRPVVVRGTQRHPVTRELQHIDFYQVDLQRVIQASVPVHLIGDAPAVATHHGVVLQGLDSVLVEALPASMPTSLEVSIESLVELEATLTDPRRRGSRGRRGGRGRRRLSRRRLGVRVAPSALFAGLLAGLSAWLDAQTLPGRVHRA